MPPNQSESADSVSLAADVDPDSEEAVSYEVPADATVEEIVVRIYRGAELDLQIVPWHNPRGGRDVKEPLVTLRGKDYIDGDGDNWRFPVSQSVEKGDTIGVTLKNTSSGEDGYTLDARTNIHVDRAGGTSRAGGLFDWIREVL